jgi:hypothetical protein
VENFHFSAGYTGNYFVHKSGRRQRSVIHTTTTTDPAARAEGSGDQTELVATQRIQRIRAASLLRR